MLPASNKGAGMNMGFPDVCLTPAVPSPVPIPYPNMAMNAMASPFCPTILLTCVPALNQGSIIPTTSGMEPGSANPLYKQMGQYTMGNPKVFLMGLPAITLTCPTTGNGMNNAAGAVTVPSATNVFFTYAGVEDDEGAITVEQAQAVARSLEGPGPAVEGRMLAGRLAFVRVARFSGDVPSAFHGCVARLSAEGAEALVIDLRANLGGEMKAAVELAGDFLGRGCLIASIEDVDGDVIEHRAQADALYAQPTCLLVDGRTASAAELFVGCLRSHGRATVIGERTYGKATAHAIVTSAEGELVYGAVGSFRLPDGAFLHGVGITPDVEVAATDADAMIAAARARLSAW